VSSEIWLFGLGFVSGAAMTVIVRRIARMTSTSRTSERWRTVNRREW